MLDTKIYFVIDSILRDKTLSKEADHYQYKLT